MPFCKSKKTIENNGMRVKNESVTQITVQKLFLRILVLEFRSTALRERAGNSIVWQSSWRYCIPAVAFSARRRTASPAILTNRVSTTRANAAYIRALS